MAEATVICRCCHDTVPKSDAHPVQTLWVCKRCDPQPDQPKPDRAENGDPSDART